jgi:hypothetical protein
LAGRIRPSGFSGMYLQTVLDTGVRIKDRTASIAPGDGKE